MPLGTEVGLGPGHIVLDGNPAPPPKKKTAALPIFAPMCCGQTAGWIKMPLSMEVGLGPGHIVLDGTQLPPPLKGAQQPHFLAHVYCGQTVAPISAIAELLFHKAMLAR